MGGELRQRYTLSRQIWWLAWWSGFGENRRSSAAPPRTAGTHPVFGLWPVALAPSLREALTIEGMREIGAWTARYRVAIVEFPSEPYDAFFNVNTPQESEEAEMLLALASGCLR